MLKNLKLVVMLIVLFTSCAAFYLESETNTEDYKAYDELMTATNKIITIFTENSTINGECAVKTPYLLSFVWAVDKDNCKICIEQARQMFVALNESQLVAKNELTLLMSTDANAVEVVTFLTNVFTDLKIDPSVILPKLNFYVFYEQKKEFSELEIYDLEFPAILIFQIISSEVFSSQMIEIYFQIGEPMSWQDFDQIILKNSE